MIKASSQRLMPPYSGQVQIVESESYRALTLDARVWEVQHVKRSHLRVGTFRQEEIVTYLQNPVLEDGRKVDEQILELLRFLKDVELPLPAADLYEYWLLDAVDNSPLALIFSCSQVEQMEKFPVRPEWTALPAAVMPIDLTEEEKKNQEPPVNYRFERLVAERAGINPKARWFTRGRHDAEQFPPLMVKEDWAEEPQRELCRRYIGRQAPRLLMLHGLDEIDRRRLEQQCRPYTKEVARFCKLYPQVFDRQLIDSICVEARLRAATEGHDQGSVQNRRDGILYI